jgi:ATPase subunit of ABC transporter with duplicated ATPase domains
VGVVGRNGCGKTSLFAAILGEIEVAQVAHRQRGPGDAFAAGCGD